MLESVTAFTGAGPIPGKLSFQTKKPDRDCSKDVAAGCQVFQKKNILF